MINAIDREWILLIRRNFKCFPFDFNSIKKAKSVWGGEREKDHWNIDEDEHWTLADISWYKKSERNFRKYHKITSISMSHRQSASLSGNALILNNFPANNDGDDRITNNKIIRHDGYNRIYGTYSIDIISCKTDSFIILLDEHRNKIQLLFNTNHSVRNWDFDLWANWFMFLPY